MNLEMAASEIREETGHVLVPCLRVIGDANLYCFDVDGTVVRWDHETNEVEAQDKNFFDVFDLELKALVERKERKKAEGTA